MSSEKGLTQDKISEQVRYEPKQSFVCSSSFPTVKLQQGSTTT